MEALLIDVLSPPFTIFNNEKFKAFFILLGLVEKAKQMAINLADRSFSHYLIIIGNILSNYINSANATCDTINKDPFTFIAINRWLSDIFFKIMIDTGASKHFTAGYRQFMPYTRDIKDTTIDILKIDAIHV